MLFKMAYFYGNTAETVIAAIKKWDKGKITFIDSKTENKKTIDENRIIYIYTFERKKDVNIPDNEKNQMDIFDILK